MKSKIPCTIIRDMIPLYAEGLVSPETKALIEEHFQECEECKQYCERMTEELEHEERDKARTEAMEINYMKKIHAYQKSNTLLGAAVSLLLGALLPLVIVGISVLARGGIPDYYLARLKIAWPLGFAQMVVSGVIVCAVYLVINRLFRRANMR